ncbi:MAG: hypothetical protein NPMRTH1_670003 [Nitrosopumilales archaeon]|nr:MAG: hypothetical protein NPMRTH1_670003 [Nitrosopumilales archaeon]
MASVEELEKICQKIMQLDPKMRSARIINNRGHLVSGGMKEGLKSLEETKHDEMMFMELALRVRMRRDFDKELGRVHFAMSYREKVIIMSFPLANDDVLLASGECEIDFSKIAFEIMDLIKGLRDHTTTF